MKSFNDMNRIHDSTVNNVSEFDLIHDILNTSKLIKYMSIHYYPILHGGINRHRGRVKHRNFRILLNGRCSSTIVMRRLTTKTKKIM